MVQPDDNTVQIRCTNHLHEFAPNSIECACGKYPNLNELTFLKKEDKPIREEPIQEEPVRTRTTEEVIASINKLRENANPH